MEIYCSPCEADACLFAQLVQASELKSRRGVFPFRAVFFPVQGKKITSDGRSSERRRGNVRARIAIETIVLHWARDH